MEITIIFPKDTLLTISNVPPADDESKRDNYIWNVFPSELDALSQFCKEINIYIDKKGNLPIRLNIGVEPEAHMNKYSSTLLRYRDLRLVFNIIYRLYNDFYVLHV